MNTTPGRLGRRVSDIVVVQRTTAFIEDLNAALDRQLLDEQRPTERLRMLRETTNRITRASNDAIQAYRRVRAAIQVELQLPDGDQAHARRMRLTVDAARDDMLRVLEVTSRRYDWAKPWPHPDPSPEPATADTAVPAQPRPA